MRDKLPASRIQSVERACDILEFLASRSTPPTLAETSRAVGLHKVTCHKLLATLEHRGLVSRHGPQPTFALAYRALALGQAFLGQVDLYGQALVQMKQLRDLSSETAGLVIRAGLRRVFIAQVESPLPIRFSVPIGRPFPLTAGASGKAILAFLSEAEIEEVLRDGLAEGRIPDQAEVTRLNRELAQIRERQYALSEGEVVPGTAAIASTVFNPTGEVAGALSLTGPVDRFNLERRLSLANELIAACRGAEAGGANRDNYHI